MPQRRRPPRAFQCSSASRKFLNTRIIQRRVQRTRSFSALQRAENSSIGTATWSADGLPMFQCSSASRKFLNLSGFLRAGMGNRKFQCSSASRKFLNRTRRLGASINSHVSVLFSEPKIPQSRATTSIIRCLRSFSALQRAENSSI